MTQQQQIPGEAAGAVAQASRGRQAWGGDSKGYSETKEQNLRRSKQPYFGLLTILCAHLTSHFFSGVYGFLRIKAKHWQSGMLQSFPPN